MGVGGVGFDGPLKHFIGSVMITPCSLKEDGVGAEDVGAAGVGIDGSFVHFFGSVVISLCGIK